MKTTLKTIFLFFTAAVMLTACSSDDKNPPTAGFSLSDLEPVQWDVVAIASNPTAADEVVYTVSGGAYEMDGNSSIQFLEANEYTVTQTVTNGDGTDMTSLTVQVEAPQNKYALDKTDMMFNTNAYWYDATAMGGTVYIRILAEVSGQDNPNLIKLYPVSGTNPLQGTYSYNASGDVGTYDAGMTANYAGFSYDWTTSGEGGDDLKIELVYEDPNNSENNIYDISLSSYTLNYGNWNFSTYTFVSEGTKSFSVQYRGKIDPVSAP
ncbi:MAG: hypothetical protein OEM04_09545 [Flavobacteriaceae bacterium]|nr:hypothetical protein [Flavobacteriaceae bacterium]